MLSSMLCAAVLPRKAGPVTREAFPSLSALMAMLTNSIAAISRLASLFALHLRCKPKYCLCVNLPVAVSKTAAINTFGSCSRSGAFDDDSDGDNVDVDNASPANRS